MSTILVNTLTGTSTAGSIAVTGEGNSTTTNLQQGLSKSFINYNQSSGLSVEASFNITSCTDSATGVAIPNLTSAMSGGDYSSTAMAGFDAGVRVMTTTTKTASNLTLNVSNKDQTDKDEEDLSCTIHGDLA